MQVEEPEIVKVKIEDLKFDSTNPNVTSDETMEGTRNSILEFGFVKPIVINENYEIADGHHRALIMKALGKQEIAAYIIPKMNDDLQRRMARQALNKLHGTHDLKLDIDELNMLLEKKPQELLEIMNIGKKEVDDLQKLLEAKSSALISDIEDEEGGIDEIDEPLSTTNKCPQCGYSW